MDKLAEVVRLSSAIAARIRYAQMVRSSVQPDQVRALLEAAKLLHAYDLPWPPLVEQVLHDVAQELESATAPPD